MFEQVNNINEIEFEEVVVKPVVIKTKEEWRNELVGFGLNNDARFFSIKGAIAPIYLALADANYSQRFGNSPRVSLQRRATNDPIFNEVCKQYKLTPVNNCGGTVEGYDFLDGKTSQEFVSFLAGLEQAYRKLKNAA